jgi:uncharacterized hydrophobic protein (TIGR00341 family)
MPLRLIEISVPDEADVSELEELLDNASGTVDRWRESPTEGRVRYRLLADAERTEPLLDELQKRFSGREGFRVILLAVEASLPRPEEDDGEEEDAEPTDEPREEEGPGRIAREELYADLNDSARLGPVYLVLIALSSIVCAFGLVTEDVAVVIGAMVIAPLLGPLVATALATTLADRELALRSLQAGTAGIGLAFLLAVGLGTVIPVDPTLPGIASRTTAGLSDVGLALASGSAGTLAFTSALPSAVIGVMVAVALVPPLVASGLLFGAGLAGPATGALLLTLVNLICVNLAGVVTFLAQGIRPNRWWEAERAKRSTRVAVAIWTLLLLALVAAILWTPAGAGMWRGGIGPLP